MPYRSTRTVSSFRVRVLRSRRLAGDVFEVELERPDGFRFRAGQSITVHVGGAARDYSLCNAESADTLLLLARRIAGGVASPLLCDSAPGAIFDISGPNGMFTIALSDLPAVLTANGVGIAPFLSWLRSQAPGPAAPVTLLHGVRRAEDLLSADELRAGCRQYVPCVSREKADGCHYGRVTDWSRDKLSPAGHDFYLCGSRQMTRDMILLVDERFPGSRVHTEIFF